MLKPWKLFKTW